MWALVAYAGVQALQGIMGAKQQNKQIKAQNKLDLETNRLNMLEADYAKFALDAQRTAVRDQTAKQLDLANRMRMQSRGSVQAQAAAAGVKGASVEHVVQDIDRDAQERKFELENQHVWSEYDITQQQVNVYGSARAALLRPRRMQSSSQILMGSVLQAGLNTAGLYANQYFKIGSGTDNAATNGNKATKGKG